MPVSIQWFLLLLLDLNAQSFHFSCFALRTIAADIRKQVTRDYGSPQLNKKRGGAHHPVSHPVFKMPEACRFEVVINKFYKWIGVLVLGL